ncbi:hypothetical protein KKC44_04800 [Patescibacteria group bacterium]|nr:hypothetical protein [Patescibacteria group bacterium]MBU2259894.1 hypothetical protein [Patescibacteria group bacterium]
MQYLSRFLCLLSGILFGLFLTIHVSAAGGTMQIQQVSNTNQLATWILSTPSGETITDSRGEYLKTVKPVIGGTYGLKVTPPHKARTTIVVYRDNQVIRKEEGSHLSFTVREGSSVRIVITHRFFGTIMVTSDPPGQSFTLKGADSVTYTGETPAGFNSVPPLYFTAEFAHKNGCRTPRKQSRLLDPNQSLFFHGVYDCREPLTVGEVEEKPEEVVPVKLLDVSLGTNQSEVLPGGTVYYTLTIQNLDKRTAEDLIVSVQFDLTQGSIGNIHNEGKLKDNLIVWEIPQIFAGRRWSTTFTLTANENLALGDRIAMTARISGEGLLEAGILEEVLTKEVGITLLPQTGMRADILFVALLVCVSTLAISIRRRRFVRVQTA